MKIFKQAWEYLFGCDNKEDKKLPGVERRVKALEIRVTILERKPR